MKIMSSLVYYFIVWPCSSPLNKIGTVNFYLNGLSEIRSYPSISVKDQKKGHLTENSMIIGKHDKRNNLSKIIVTIISLSHNYRILSHIFYNP